MLAGNGSEYEAHNHKDGSFSFTLTLDKVGTYTYTLLEKQEGSFGGITFDPTTYLITVTVINGNGKLEASYTVEDGKTLEFVNKYNTIGTELVIEGTKELVGRDPDEGEFTFVLTNTAGQSITASNDESGRFYFVIPYSEPGIRTYTLTERNDGKGGITYDTNAYTIQVSIIDNGDRTLSASIIDKADYVFTNSYRAEETTLEIKGNKLLIGKSLDENKFTFVLSGNGYIKEVKNAANGEFVFTLTFAEAGTYTYTITEKNEGKGGITYDTTSYTVTVTVVDNLDGTLSAAYTVENNAKLEFVNVYNNGALETGDSSVLCLPLILAAGFGALGLLYYKKKKETI